MCKINGKKLAEIRKENGMTQEQFAEVLGVSRSAIQNYEKERSEPTPENLKKICMLLKINQGEIEVREIGYDFLNDEGKLTAQIRKKSGFVRYTSPEQTQAWIVNKRKDAEVKIKSEIKNAFNSAIVIAGKKYILINPTYINIPDWQRDTDNAKTTEIAENFEDAKYDPVKVYLVNGKLFVADGAHRIVAIIKINEQRSEDNQLKILVEVLDCDEYEAARIFLGQKSGKKTMTVNDMYRAGIKANVPEYVHFKELFEKHNIQISAENHLLDNPVGRITPSSAALRLTENNKEMLESIICLIKQLHWSGSDKSAFILRNFQTIKKLYSNFGSEKVNTKLLEHCKGAVYYESKIFPVKSNAEVYDILAEEIVK